VVANIVIRFLTNDDSVQSPIAYQFFKKAVHENLTLIFYPLVVAECCYVLESKRYGYTKDEVAEKLRQLVLSSNIRTIEMETIQASLQAYSQHNVDFTDAFLAASVNNSFDVHATITWNRKDFNRLSTEFYAPEDIISAIE
jgi:predicted nucleic-acid-binding protein